MSLILKQEPANTIATPPAGKTTMFVTETNTLSTKGPDGTVTSFPTVQGSNTQVLFNDDGAINGDSGLVYNKTNDTMTVANLSVTGTLNAGDISVSSIANGTSNVDIVGVSGNVTVSVAGVANVLTVASTGANVAGTFSASGNANVGNLGVSAIIANTGTSATTAITGIAKTAGSTRATGIQGQANVASSSDSGAAVGIRGYATDTHAGGYNIGVLGNAVNSGLGNYAFYIQNGFMGSIENPTGWDLYDNSQTSITFQSSGKANIFGIDTTDNFEGIYTSGYLNVVGNATVGNLIGALANGTSNVNIPTASGNVNTSVGGNINVTIVTGTGLQVNGTVSSTGNANLGNVGTSGIITATGNITGGNLVSSGALSASGNANIGNIGTAGLITATGNIQGGNISTGGTIAATGNVSGGNLTTAGQVVATGNVSGGNVSAASAITAATLTTTGTITVGNIGTANGSFSGNLNIVGNTNSGNIISNGFIYSNSNIQANTNIIASNAAYIGNGAASTSFVNPTIIGKNAGATYIQAALVNSTNTGSADWVAYSDNGNDIAGWNDWGFTGSNFNDANYTITGKNDGYMFTQAVNGTGLGGNLVFATGDQGTTNDLVFATGGFLTANEKMRFINASNQFYIKPTTVSTTTSTGALRVGGGVGVAGNINAGGNINGGNLAVTGLVDVSGGIHAEGAYSGGATDGLVMDYVHPTARFSAYGSDGFKFFNNGVANVELLSISSAGAVVANANVTSNGTFIGNALTSVSSNLTISANGTNKSILLQPTGTGTVDAGNARITSVAEPSASTDVATKNYVDTTAQGLSVKQSAAAGTTGTLATASGGTVTYNNGSSGVGATLTTTGSYTLIDGVNIASAGTRILVKNEANTVWNGIYTYTSGTVLTRSTDFDNSPGQEIAGAFVFIADGTVNDNTGWVCTNTNPVTVGTTGITFTQFSGAGTYTAGTGLTLTGTQFSITNTAVSAASYGSSTAIPTFTVNQQGQLTAASTAAVVAPAGTLSGTTLNSTVVNSSLTAVGTLASLSVSGNANIGNVGTAGQYVSTVATGTAPFVVTSTTQVANLNVATAGVAGYVTAAAQSNITSLGTLSGLTVSTPISGSVTGSAATVTTAAQPNITSVGTLTSLSVTGNVNAGNVIATHYGAATGLTSIPGANVTGTLSVPTTSYSATVSTAAQPNITSVGTLTSLTVSGATTVSGNSALTTTNLTSGANTTLGYLTGNWTLTAGSKWNATYADLSEKYVADADYEPGTVLVFGGEHEVTVSNEMNTTRVAGVVTTDAAYTMNSGLVAEHVADIALQGRVPCKVIGPIYKGDLLVSAGNGHAIANNEARAGTIIGKSLENFTDATGIIEVAVGRF